MAGGVWMQTNGCGWVSSLADHAIEMPGNAVKSDTKYWARSILSKAVPAARHSASA